MARTGVDVIDGQRGRLFLWLPVGFGTGIGSYFALPLEPGPIIWIGIALMALALLISLTRLPPLLAPPAVAALVILMGFGAAGLRAHLVAAPVLGFRYYGPVEGRVIRIDRSASDARRLTLDRVVLTDFSLERTPARVRVSLHAAQEFITPEPGMRLAVTAHLSPPPGPAEPGGFDFKRMAWFDRLGAVGYSRSPALRAGAAEPYALLGVHRLRQTMSDALQTRLPGQRGAFAAAILTGDRTGISPATSEALRGANLSHLLAISGLHMGLLTGVVFYALRLVLALIPGAALKYPIKKIAAMGALMAGGFYLALSGFNVATERAFTMISVMFIAVLLDRRAISLRTVAIAALIILAFQPEVLPEPGFQMSFAATTALVAVFSILRRMRLMVRWPPAARVIVSVVISSAVAGIATAPVAAAHFNRIADYGLLANVLAVPLMGAVVIPAAVFALLLLPIGAEGVALWAMGQGIGWILGVAGTVSSWQGAVTHIASPPGASLPLIAFGGLFVILWRGRWQGIGIAPVALGFMLWAMAERPALLIADDGSLTGRMTAQGRWLSKDKGSGFAAGVWLENDGDLPDQARAAARPPVPLDLGGLRIRQVTGRGWQEAARAACAEADLVILNQLWEEAPLTDCLLIDLGFLCKSGSLALSASSAGGGALRLTSAYGASGLRLWNTPALRWDPPRRAGEVKEKLPPYVMGTVFNIR
nr:ComEC/Rec2 family competence protein [Celeribacter neptunius]